MSAQPDDVMAPRSAPAAEQGVDWSRMPSPWKPTRRVSVPAVRPYATMKTPDGRPGVEVGIKGKF